MAKTTQAQKELTGLSGHYFHSFKDGQVNCQGKIICEVKPDLFMVQFYDWLSGGETNRELVNLDSMLKWHFYGTNQDMKDAYECRLMYMKPTNRAKEVELKDQDDCFDLVEFLEEPTRREYSVFMQEHFDRIDYYEELAKEKGLPIRELNVWKDDRMGVVQQLQRLVTDQKKFKELTNILKGLDKGVNDLVFNQNHKKPAQDEDFQKELEKQEQD